MKIKNILRFNFFISFSIFVYLVNLISTLGNEKDNRVITLSSDGYNIRVIEKFFKLDEKIFINDNHEILIFCFLVLTFCISYFLSTVKLEKFEGTKNDQIFITVVSIINLSWLLSSLFIGRLKFTTFSNQICSDLVCNFQPSIMVVIVVSIILSLCYRFKHNKSMNIVFLFLLIFPVVFNLLSISTSVNSDGGIFCCGYTNIDSFRDNLNSNYSNLDYQWEQYGKVGNSSRFEDFLQTKRFVEIGMENKTPYGDFPWIAYGPLTFIIFDFYEKILKLFNISSPSFNTFFLYTTIVFSIISLTQLLKVYVNIKNYKLLMLGNVTFFSFLFLSNYVLSENIFVFLFFLIFLVSFIIFIIKKLEYFELKTGFVILALVSTFPMMYAVDRGNIDMMFLPLFTYFYLNIKKKNYRISILLLAIICSIKLIYIFMGILFVAEYKGTSFLNMLKKEIRLDGFSIPLLITTVFIHSFGFLYMGNYKQAKEYLLNFINFRNIGSASPPSYTGHNGSFDGYLKQTFESLRTGYFVSGDSEFILWGFWNLIKYNSYISLLTAVIILLVTIYLISNLKIHKTSFYLVISLILLMFSPSSPIYRFVILIPVVLMIIYSKDLNLPKSFIFFIAILLSITDLIYFKSYLEIVSTSSIFTFLISLTLVFQIIFVNKKNSTIS